MSGSFSVGGDRLAFSSSVAASPSFELPALQICGARPVRFFQPPVRLLRVVRSELFPRLVFFSIDYRQPYGYLLFPFRVMFGRYSSLFLLRSPSSFEEALGIYSCFQAALWERLVLSVKRSNLDVSPELTPMGGDLHSANVSPVPSIDRLKGRFTSLEGVCICVFFPWLALYGAGLFP